MFLIKFIIKQGFPHIFFKCRSLSKSMILKHTHKRLRTVCTPVKKLTLLGPSARVFQQELDHINGKLIIDLRFSNKEQS